MASTPNAAAVTPYHSADYFSRPLRSLSPRPTRPTPHTARSTRRPPAHTSFDEVHFGGFAAKYIRRRYFMDVHPPLAKLLVTLSAWLGRFDGKFDFKDIGK